MLNREVRDEPDQIGSVQTAPPALRGKTERTISFLKLCCLVSWSIAVNLGINVTFVLAPPLFFSLGVSSVGVNWATSSGPIGLALQPIFGAWSDSVNKRRPFILAGGILSVIGMIGFANSRNFADIFDASVRWPAISLAVVSLALINLGFASIQATSLGLMFDHTVTNEDKNLAAGFLSAAYGLAGVLGNALGFVDFRAALTFFHSNMEAAFYVGLIVFVITLIPTLVISTAALPELEVAVDIDTPLLVDTAQVSQKSDARRAVGFVVAMKELVLAVIHMEGRTVRLFLAWWTSCAAGYPWVLYFTEFVGQEVFKGDPEAAPHTAMRKAYEEGVRWGSLSLTVMGLVTVAISLLAEPLVKVIGHKALYMIGHLWGATAMASTALPAGRTVPTSLVFCSLAGIYNGLTTVIPYALLALVQQQQQQQQEESNKQSNSHSHSGTLAGLLNLVNVLAQLIAGAISAAVMQATEQLYPGIALCALYAVLGLPLILII